MTYRKLSLFIGLLVSGLFFAQTKEQLQKQSAELQKQISIINENLAKARSESRLSVAYLNGLNARIGLREKVYTNTQKEKRFIEDDIYLRQLEINKYNRELGVLRKNYAEVLVKVYKNKGIQNKITFILSSKNLSQAFRRMQYLKKYAEYQDKKTQEIVNKTKQVQRTIALRQKAINDKESLLVRQQKGLNTIQVERKEKEVLLEDFRKNETKLTAELRQKQTQSKKIEGEIRRIIAEEIRLARAKAEAEKKLEAEKIRLAKIAADKEKARIAAENKKKIEEAETARKRAEAEERKLVETARKRAEEERRLSDAKNEEKRLAAERVSKLAADKAREATNKVATAKANEAAINKKNEDEKKAAEEKAKAAYGIETVSAGSSFSANRGRMSFPVSGGQITQRFGRQKHPVLNVEIDSNGIIIVVSPGTKAKAVFPGTVVGIILMDGNKSVMVKHGDYFTVYGNLSNVYVSKNQKITAGTLVGEVGTDFDNTYSLDFQVWSGSTAIDPLGWVAR